MSTNDGGPAFPGITGRMSILPDGSVRKLDGEGMTLRDYFAAKAMQANLTSDNAMRYYNSGVTQPYEAFARVAKDCYIMADAMLEARKP